MTNEHYLYPGDHSYNIGSALEAIRSGTLADLEAAISYLKDELIRQEKVLAQANFVKKSTIEWIGTNDKKNTAFDEVHESGSEPEFDEAEECEDKSILKEKINLKLAGLYKTRNGGITQIEKRISYIDQDFFVGCLQNKYNEFGGREVQWLSNGNPVKHIDTDLYGFEIVEEITLEQFETILRL